MSQSKTCPLSTRGDAMLARWADPVVTRPSRYAQSMTLPELDASQHFLLEETYRVFKKTCDWPSHQYLDIELDAQLGVAIESVLQSLPPNLLLPDPGTGNWYFQEHEKVQLTAAALALIPEAENGRQLLLETVKLLTQLRKTLRPESPNESKNVELTTAELISALEQRGLGPIAKSELALLFEMLRIEPFLPNWAGVPEDVLQRKVPLSRELRRFNAVETYDDYLELRAPAPPQQPLRATLPLPFAAAPTFAVGGVETLDLHARLVPEVAHRIRNGDWSAAAFYALREVEVYVRELGGFSANDLGVSLMRSAFNPTTGPLTDPALEAAEGQAMSALFWGALGLYKNTESHRKVELPPDEARRVVVLADLLLRLVERVAAARGIVCTSDTAVLEQHA